MFYDDEREPDEWTPEEWEKEQERIGTIVAEEFDEIYRLAAQLAGDETPRSITLDDIPY